MFWMMALLLFGQQVEVRPEPVWSLPAAADIMRCGRRLGDQPPAYDVTLTCRVNDQGRPSDCGAQRGHSATPRELDAARCIARSYRLTNPESRDAEGRVMLRIVAVPG